MEIKSFDINNEIERLHSEVKQLLDAKYSEEDIIELFQKKGFERHYTETIIGNIHNDKSDRKSFRFTLALGIFSLVGGLILNFLSYRIAENFNASFFYLFWGIVVFGILTIFRAYILYKKK